jgi:hypothetical protein
MWVYFIFIIETNKLMKRILFLLMLTAQYSFAQVAVYDNEKFDDLKKGTLYVYVTHPEKESGIQMVAAIKSAWNVSKLEILSNPNIPERLLVPGNYFVTEDHSQTSFQFERVNRATGERSYSESVTNDHYYLNFWSIDPKYKAGKNIENNKESIARAELFRRSMGQDPSLTATIVMDETIYLNEYLNGTAAQVRNMFQNVNEAVKNNAVKKMKDEMHSSPGLAALKKDTLFVPNIWAGPGGTQIPEDNKYYKNYGKRIEKYLADMIGDYDHPVKLIRRDELSEKILKSATPVYYLNYIQSSADKMVSVINGLTGEIIYYDFVKKSYRPKGKDFKTLSDAVGGSN